MRKNRSPWLHQLDTERTNRTLQHDVETDVAIVGAGIAGVSTAFEILERTTQSVTLIDRFLMAHGATGHNAGQIVAHFERGLASLVEEYGLEKATHAQRDVENAWSILEHMYKTAKLKIPFFKFIGHSGYTSVPQLLFRLENNRLRVAGGLEKEIIRIANTVPSIQQIPKLYDGLYELVDPGTVLALLETEDTGFIGVSSYPKGCVNSALFCEQLVLYMLKTYPDRFHLYEHTPIGKIILRDSHAILDAHEHTITAGRVVLCTNGFENLHILNETGLDIDYKYHVLIEGKMGYMSGYLEEHNKPAVAISYYTDPSTSRDNSYYYLTRREYEYESGTKHNLICIGGPDTPLEDRSHYSHEEEYPEERAEEIDRFVRRVYDTTPNKAIDYQFTWHGLMGYTRSGVRLIGPEPKNPILLYNLGCNGVGILPSIYGGQKIARHIAGEHVPPSMFDIPDVSNPPRAHN